MVRVHYFIHLNLAISLFLAYFVFVLGIQLARENEVYITGIIIASFKWFCFYIGSMYICGSTIAVFVSVCFLLDDV